MVVTRFAPSPTGYLHVGGARTALFCWLLARHHGGRLVLRIEDTDRRRNTPEAVRQVMEDLRWLGIEWDEGPGVGGPNGPYFQSQRLDIYRKYVAELVGAGKAYHCFDTTDELEALRRAAEAGKENFIYPRPGRFPDASDVKRARSEGRPVTVRFAVPTAEPVVIEDAVRGRVEVPAGQIGDLIIQKADGFPTYHLACVVDDELMGVTHVVRGQEHLLNTHFHVLLQRAMGFRTPVYAHMSVTVSEGGGKLSKRERPKALRNALGQRRDADPDELAAAAGVTGELVRDFVAGRSVPDMKAVDAMAAHLGVPLPEINVADFFKSGYVPEALVNFIALLGWSPGLDREIMSREDMIGAFDLSRLAKSNSLFDRKKLAAFNTEHIRMLDAAVLLSHFKRYLAAAGSPLAGASDEMLGEVLNVSKGARTLAEIDAKSRFLVLADDDITFDPKAVKKVLAEGGGLAVLPLVRSRLLELGGGRPGAADIEKCLRSIADSENAPLGRVAQPLRVCLCGGTVSPPIFDSVRLLGLERTAARIDRAMAMCKSSRVVE
jgi:glutamyl-tRNA synthetase